MNYSKLAQEILALVGGNDNVENMSHCSTRLRFVVSDLDLVDMVALDEHDDVKGAFVNAGQLQIILGPGTVQNVYAQMNKNVTTKEESYKESADNKLSPLQRMVKKLSDIFVPIIPAIVAGGLLMGINNVLTAPDLFYAGKSLIDQFPQVADLAAMLNTFSNAAFVFLPVLIGFSATKAFGGNPYLGAALGMIMVHPDLLNAYALADTEVIPVWNIFGFAIEKVGYQGTVLPVLMSAFILAKLETFFHEKITPALDNLLSPLLAILLTALLTFIIVGPMMRSLGDLITVGLIWIYTTLGVFGGLLMGFFYAPIVITGMHHSFIAVETQLISNVATTGGSFIFPIAAMSNVAQGAATLAVYAISKNQKEKSTAMASGISALLGITEPAMFGVNLKLQYPFIAAIIGSAVGGAYVAYSKTLAIALGAAGLPGIISITAPKVVHYIIAMVLSMTVAFIMTFVLSKKNKGE